MILKPFMFQIEITSQKWNKPIVVKMLSADVIHCNKANTQTALRLKLIPDDRGSHSNILLHAFACI